MTDAHARLLAARDVLNRAERAVGLRARDDIEHGSTGASPILLGPTSRSELIRLLIDVCPTGGWIGVCGVGDIGWEWAAQQGMDLDRVLVLNAEKDSPLVDLCALLVDACDVICLDIPGGARPLHGTHHRDAFFLAGAFACPRSTSANAAGDIGA